MNSSSVTCSNIKAEYPARTLVTAGCTRVPMVRRCGAVDLSSAFPVSPNSGREMRPSVPRATQMELAVGRVYCPCGNTISDVLSPSDWTGDYISSSAMDELEGPAPVSFIDLLNRTHGIIECTQCGRLAMDVPGSGGGIKWYSPDDGKPGNLMRTVHNTDD